MRTTLSLEPEIAAQLRVELTFGKRPFKEVVNDALRRILVIQEKAPSAPFQVHPYSSVLRPGVYPGELANRSRRQMDISGAARFAGGLKIRGPI
jgi:hypothetical protein